MEYFDLESLFMDYVRGIVLSDKDRFSDVKEIEKNLMKMYLTWTDKPLEKLDGFTPKEYVDILDKNGNLYDYTEYILKSGKDVSDIVTDKIVAKNDVSDFVKDLLLNNEKEIVAYAFGLMFEVGGEAFTDICIEILKNGEKNPEKVSACYEFLAENNEDAVAKILAIMYECDEDTQFLFSDIMSNYPNNDSIFMWLITMLYRGKELSTVAEMLGRFGDNKAVNMINSFILDKDLNYIEFMELRNAVERLGGDFAYEKDFTEDEYYKMIVAKNNDKATESNEGKNNGNA